MNMIMIFITTESYLENWRTCTELLNTVIYECTAINGSYLGIYICIRVFKKTLKLLIDNNCHVNKFVLYT